MLNLFRLNLFRNFSAQPKEAINQLYFTPSKYLDFKESEFLLIYQDKKRFFEPIINLIIRSVPIAITGYLIKKNFCCLKRVPNISSSASHINVSQLLLHTSFYQKHNIEK